MKKKSYLQCWMCGAKQSKELCKVCDANLGVSKLGRDLKRIEPFVKQLIKGAKEMRALLNAQQLKLGD